MEPVDNSDLAWQIFCDWLRDNDKTSYAEVIEMDLVKPPVNVWNYEYRGVGVGGVGVGIGIGIGGVGGVGVGGV